ncbi:twin-arginine translocase TatA/TatE family subunit [Desulfobacter curvatus]|uniref:twin-arginine translocase TatA/TatE family subunit n=1 Tax=Desulfobacter curvatus TaxID=2290 RepID=UPI00039AF620|nr:twin-arginine translocase TatA/TatE family subunit [Desulfobacter curvatus]
MFGLGMPEILLILAIALIVIGPQKLPEVAKTLGKAMGEFKRSAQDLKNSIDAETTVKEVKPKPVKTKLKDVIKDIGTEDSKQEQASDNLETPDKADGVEIHPPEPTQDSPAADTSSPASPETETLPPKE